MIDRDIDDAAQAAQLALRESRERFRRMFEVSPDSITLVTLDEGIFVEVNSAFERFTGYGATEVLGRPAGEFDLWIDPSQRKFMYEQVRAGRTVRDLEARIRRKDGEERIGLRFATGVDMDSVPHLLSIMRDITPWKKAETALQRERDFAQSLINSAPMIMVLLDLEGRIRHVNPYFENISGYDLDEIRGSDWFRTFLPERDRDRIRALFRIAVRDTPTRGNINAIVTRSGEEREVEWNDQVVRDDQGAITGVLAIGQDVTDRAAMQKREREGRQRLQDILDSMFAFVGLYTPEGIVIEANRAPLDAAGLRREDVIGKPFWEAYWWSHSRGAQEQVRDALLRAARGETVRADFSVRIAQDRFITIDATFGAIRDDRGRVTQLVGSGVDVSARMFAEQEIERSRAMLQAVVDATPDWIFAKDREHRILFANRAIAASQGLAPEDMVGRLDSEIWPLELCVGNSASGIRGFHADDDEALAGRTLHNPADPASLADGSVHLFDTLKLPLRDAGGRIYGVLGYARDVTQRKHIEDALRASEEQLREAQRIARIGYWSLDLARNVLLWSDEIFRIFEIDNTRFGATYEAFLNAVHPEDREAVNDAYTRSLEARESYDITHRLLMPDGRVKFVHERCESDFDTHGKPVRSLGTVQDVTEQMLAELEIRRLNAELEQRVRERTAALEGANRELETFTYSVAHDLKAPLRGIDGYSRLLLADYSDKLDDTGRQFLVNVRQAALQMNELIDDLLAYSHLERREMHTGPVDMRVLLEALLAERADELRQRAVALSVAVPFAQVRADREGLTMALRNLLENALKFTRDVMPPLVEIGGREQAGSIVLWVRDNGVGFDMKYHEQIFGMFQRLYRPEEYPGTGIGLSIVRKAMERMAGRAWAKGEPGKGATFYLEIPQ